MTKTLEREAITTIMCVNRSALKSFKKKAVELDMTMIELHERLANLPLTTLREIMK